MVDTGKSRRNALDPSKVVEDCLSIDLRKGILIKDYVKMWQVDVGNRKAGKDSYAVLPGIGLTK